MSYTIKPDEFALVLKPVFDVDGSWSGSITTGITMGGAEDLPLEVQQHMVGVVTMLSAFLEYGSDNPLVIAEVEEYRDRLLQETFGEEFDNATPDEIKEKSNVLFLDRFTRTKGSC